jgi:hypothetical protein
MCAFLGCLQTLQSGCCASFSDGRQARHCQRIQMILASDDEGSVRFPWTARRVDFPELSGCWSCGSRSELPTREHFSDLKDHSFPESNDRASARSCRCGASISYLYLAVRHASVRRITSRHVAFFIDFRYTKGAICITPPAILYQGHFFLPPATRMLLATQRNPAVGRYARRTQPKHWEETMKTRLLLTVAGFAIGFFSPTL